MRWLIRMGVLVMTAGSVRAEPLHHEVRVELGVGGPLGEAGVRYRYVFNATSIEPGIGVAYTGLIGSLLVGRRVLTLRDSPHEVTTVGGYAGYSIAVLDELAQELGAADNRFVPKGTYQWVDIGVSLRGDVLSHLSIVGGIGLSIIVAGPSVPTAEDANPFVPEWWLHKRFGPQLWAGVGYRF